MKRGPRTLNAFLLQVRTTRFCSTDAPSPDKQLTIVSQDGAAILLDCWGSNKEAALGLIPQRKWLLRDEKESLKL
jgi:hypothetical protein